MSEKDIQNCDLKRVYKIQYAGTEVFTPGRNAAGEQVLVGQLDDELLVAIFFSRQGKYLRYEFCPVVRKDVVIPELVEEYMRHLGVTPRDIRIRHFAFPDWDIGIAEWYQGDFPDVQRALAAGEPLEDDRLVEWQEERHWIMHWKNEFEMSDDGEVLSS